MRDRYAEEFAAAAPVVANYETNTVKPAASTSNAPRHGRSWSSSALRGKGGEDFAKKGAWERKAEARRKRLDEGRARNVFDSDSEF